MRNHETSITLACVRITDTTSQPTGLRPSEPASAGSLESLGVHADLCRVLTDPKRLMILHALGEGERTVTELASELGCTMPNASQHLTVLRSAGLVTGQRDGTTIRYHLSEPDILTACDIVAAIAARLHGRPASRRTA